MNDLGNIGNIVPYLRCPISQRKLRILSSEEIIKYNNIIEGRKVKYLSGEVVGRKIVSGLISADGKTIYEVNEQIAYLLPQLAICVKNGKNSARHKKFHLKKKDVRKFYDSIGWIKGKNSFTDARINEDLRKVSSEYVHKCHMRVKNHLGPSGKFLVDVASGPVQFPQYQTYSENFDYHVCVDFSILALKEAKKKLKKHGIYILGDITCLPFADGTVDAVVSINTIYHVPASEQPRAFGEVSRILKPKATAVVVYSWRGALAMQFFVWPGQKIMNAYRAARSKIRPRPDQEEVALYFHPHSYKWFVGRKWPFKYAIYSWRSVNVPFLKIFIHRRLLGKQLLKIIYALESKYPKFAGKIGQYPLIVISK